MPHERCLSTPSLCWLASLEIIQTVSSFLSHFLLRRLVLALFNSAVPVSDYPSISPSTHRLVGSDEFLKPSSPPRFFDAKTWPAMTEAADGAEQNLCLFFAASNPEGMKASAPPRRAIPTQCLWPVSRPSGHISLETWFGLVYCRRRSLIH